MPFTVGQNYTRDEIHAELGGDTQSFLPWSGGRIVCGCFKTDLNPDVPDVVLVGGSDEAGNILKRAKLLVAQGGTLPVFMKQASNQWSYEGAYRLTRQTEDPDELRRYVEAAGRTNVAMALFFEPVTVVRRTYLLTWNPNEYPWADIEADAQAVIDGRKEPSEWSCGNTKRIRLGDRFFMLRQGVEPRGIVAAGWVTSDPFEKPHWDEQRAEQGVKATYVGVRFERILVPPQDDPLPVSDLKTGELASVNWRPQRSGMEVRNGVAELERLWKRHLDAYDSDNGDGLSAIEGGVTMALRRHRFRERKLRDAKLADYKMRHEGRLPCEECGLDFLAVYGEIGRDFAHVHHREPLGGRKGPSVTRMQDLAVVCANCHAMLHRGGDALPPGHLLKRSQGDGTASPSI